MRNPMPKKKISPEQEARIEQADLMHVRADTFAAGVAATLTNGGYGRFALKELARILTEAEWLHEEAYRLQDLYRTGADANRVPGPRTIFRRARRVHAKKG